MLDAQTRAFFLARVTPEIMSAASDYLHPAFVSSPRAFSLQIVSVVSSSSALLRCCRFRATFVALQRVSDLPQSIPRPASLLPKNKNKIT